MGKPNTLRKIDTSGYEFSENGTIKVKSVFESKAWKKSLAKAPKLEDSFKRHKHVAKAPLDSTCKANDGTQKKAGFLAGVCPVPRKGAYHGSTVGTAGVHKSKAPKPQKAQPPLTGFLKLERGTIKFVNIEVPKVKTRQEVWNLIKSGKIGPTTEVDFVNKKGKIERNSAHKAMEVLPVE